MTKRLKFPRQRFAKQLGPYLPWSYSHASTRASEVHDRMPVLLTPEQFEHWLNGDMGVDDLKPAPNDYLQRWPVSKRVNSSKADKDDASIVEQIETVAARR
jgi:putative SOS response-associated peptidase YedK